MGRMARGAAKKAPKAQLPQLSGPRMPQGVINKVGQLLRHAKLNGHPRAAQEDVVGALIDAATEDSVIEALGNYNDKLGKALVELEDESAEG
jgi:hypothetical protein